MIQDEMEKYKKEARDRKKEFEKKIAEKNTRINDLLTDLENMKTDLNNSESRYTRLNDEKDQLIQDIQMLNKKLKEETQNNKDTQQKLQHFLHSAEDEQAHMVEMEQKLIDVKKEKDQEIEQLKEEMACKSRDIATFYNYSRFDCDFAWEATSFLKIDKNKTKK